MKYLIACVLVAGLAASVPAISDARGKGNHGRGNQGKDRGERNSEWKAEQAQRKDKQQEWRQDRVESLQHIDGYLVRYRFPEQQSVQIVNAFDQAIAGGMAIDDARKKIVRGPKDGDTRRNLMIDTAQTSLELLR